MGLQFNRYTQKKHMNSMNLNKKHISGESGVTGVICPMYDMTQWAQLSRIFVLLAITDNMA